ncbi:retrovirus-related pol polyprotein from transposon TNT 1-94 [Tanacetum coccineum]
MTENRSRLINFVHKFLGTVRFGNDQIAKIMGYGDYQMGNVTISWVYYVEGLGHNLYSVGQFCDYDLEVAFRKHTCYIRDLEGVDLLKGSRGSNLYTLSLEDMMLSSPICLWSKASKTKSWLWHRRLSHLNFNFITTLAKQGEEDVFETPKGKDSGETDISPSGLQAAETLVQVASQKTKTYTRRVKSGLKKKLDVGVSSGDTKFKSASEEIKSASEEIKSGFTNISSGEVRVSQRKGKEVLEEQPQPKRSKKQIREEEASLAEIARI